MKSDSKDRTLMNDRKLFSGCLHPIFARVGDWYHFLNNSANFVLIVYSAIPQKHGALGN